MFRFSTCLPTKIVQKKSNFRHTHTRTHPHAQQCTHAHTHTGCIEDQFEFLRHTASIPAVRTSSAVHRTDPTPRRRRRRRLRRQPRRLRRRQLRTEVAAAPHVWSPLTRCVGLSRSVGGPRQTIQFSSGRYLTLAPCGRGSRCTISRNNRRRSSSTRWSSRRSRLRVVKSLTRRPTRKTKTSSECSMEKKLHLIRNKKLES